MKKYVAEFVAAFFLVFAGAGAIISDHFLSQVRVVDSFGPLGIALAHGLALAVAIAAVMRISGGHANPAISLAFFVARRLSFKDLIGYVVGQCAGAVAAAFLLSRLLAKQSFEFTSGGIPGLGEGVESLQGAAIEVVLTFFLAFVIWGVAVDRKGPNNIAPLAIGLTLVFDILAGGPFTGAAMNPARWLGPAVASGNFSNAIVWVAGPILGALLASLLYETLFLTDQPAEEMGAVTKTEFEEEIEEEYEFVNGEPEMGTMRASSSPPVAPPLAPPPTMTPEQTYAPPPPPPPAGPSSEQGDGGEGEPRTQ